MLENNQTKTMKEEGVLNNIQDLVIETKPNIVPHHHIMKIQ